MPNPLHSAMIDATAATVRAEAARRNIRQTEICEALDLNQNAVSRRMLGKIEWSASQIAKLADLLQVSASDLLGEPTAAAS